MEGGGDEGKIKYPSMTVSWFSSVEELHTWCLENRSCEVPSVSVGSLWRVEYGVVAVEVTSNEGGGDGGLLEHFFKVKAGGCGLVYIVNLERNVLESEGDCHDFNYVAAEGGVRYEGAGDSTINKDGASLCTTSYSWCVIAVVSSEFEWPVFGGKGFLEKEHVH